MGQGGVGSGEELGRVSRCGLCRRCRCSRWGRRHGGLGCDIYGYPYLYRASQGDSNDHRDESRMLLAQMYGAADADMG